MLKYLKNGEHLKSPMSKSLNLRGAGIAEAVIALGLLATMGLIVATLNSAISKADIGLRTKSNMAALVNTIRSQLNYSAPCASSLSTGFSLTPAIIAAANGPGPYPEVTLNLPHLSAGINQNLQNLVAGQTLPLLGLTVSSLTLRNVHPTGNFAVAPQTEYYGQFFIRLSRTSDKFSFRPILIGGVTMEVDPANKIVSCSNLIGADEQAACVQLSCNWIATNPVGTQCVCNPYLKGCTLPGTYPTQIASGAMVCLQLGSALTCPKLGGGGGGGKNTYLRGVGLGKNYCAPLPDMTPTPYCNIISGTTSWTEGGTGGVNTCKASSSIFAFTNSVSVLDTTGGGGGGARYGQGDFTCVNGIAIPGPTSTCAANAPCTIGSRALSWQDLTNTYTCTNDSAFSNITSSSTVLAISESTLPNHGKANFQCLNGVLTVAPGATCAPRICLTGTPVGGSTGASCPSNSIANIQAMAASNGCTKNLGACPATMNSGEYCIDSNGVNSNLSCSPTIYNWQGCAPPTLPSVACSAYTCLDGDTNDACCCPNMAGGAIPCTAPANGPSSNRCGCFGGFQWSWTCVGGITQNTSSPGVCP